MSDATALVFGTAKAPLDESPEVEEQNDTGHVPFDPAYPDSTRDAPYGYKPDGTPYKRHHGKGKRSSGAGNMPASDKQAATAAALLARLNGLFGIALTVSGMPKAAVTLAANNGDFEVMAKEALLADPVLCRKILSAGATSGKAGLLMAYIMLGASTYPAMRDEYRENHPKELELENES
jgi:hypothetical protein